ncbi:MAG: phage tail sheath C-terminal domain-containing protein [Burkholderiales bacterium]
MPPVMKTPGVYIVEKNAFPNSIVEVATAVPAFVGYTQKADNNRHTLTDKPWRITSLAEFHQYFGLGPTAANVTRFKLRKAQGNAAASPVISLAARDAAPITLGGTAYQLTQTKGFYLLYFSLLTFFQNGGGPCYIVSVGSYDAAAGTHIEKEKLIDGIRTLAGEQEPTMLVVPDAVLLEHDDCIAVQKEALHHCGNVMKNRIAILDIWQGYRDRHSAPDCVAAFREDIGAEGLSYGSAYYPWLNTNVVAEAELNCTQIESDSQDLLIEGIKAEFAAMSLPAAKLTEMSKLAEQIKLANSVSLEEAALLTKKLRTVSPFFTSIMAEMRKRLNLLPPGAAMAGIFTMVDNSRGVWKAPANVSVNGVINVCVPISHEQQDDLNVTPQGKSINAIRDFVGEGVLVWGARTLDGNSLDYRYINVRRTLIMLEESIRLAAKAMVFEPNTADTWATIKSMIVNFLTGIWKRGGLAGSKPEDAFNVLAGLGVTMTQQDILDGLLRVTVLVALSRPAEFIEITFEQKMQTS